MYCMYACMFVFNVRVYRPVSARCNPAQAAPL